MDFYEKFANCYDNMINWESRLHTEKPDLKTLLKKNDIKTIVDAGCGTGVHSIFFAEIGLNVIGVDHVEEMLTMAAENAKESGTINIDFRLGDFLHLKDVLKKQVDCVACLGNSLPHLVLDADIIEALKQFKEVLKPGGLCLIQLVHFDHYLDSDESAVAVSEGLRNGEYVIYRRHYEFKGTKVIFHVSIYDREKKELLENYSIPLNAIRKDLLGVFFERAGFTDVQTCRDFAYNPITKTDRSVVFIARKPLVEKEDILPTDSSEVKDPLVKNIIGRETTPFS